MLTPTNRTSDCYFSICMRTAWSYQSRQVPIWQRYTVKTNSCQRPTWCRLSCKGHSPAGRPKVQTCRTSHSSLQLQDLPFGLKGVTLLCDMSTGRAQPIIPTSWRRKIFEAIHSPFHPSVWATKKLISAKYIWTGLQKQLRTWTKECIMCQASKLKPTSRFQWKGLAYPAGSSITSMLTWLVCCPLQMV